MNYIFLAVIFFSSLNISKAQSENQIDSLYLIAFQKYTIELDSFYLEYRKEPLKPIYIEKTNYIGHIPSKIGKRDVVFLTKKNSFKVYKENKNSLMHLKIFPIKLNGDIIKITFIPYYGKFKNKRTLSLSLSDWTTIYFKYNCTLKTWEYLESKNGGI